ncbi:MAG: nucleotide pyrophosphohydrolase [Thermoprotei archaeon]
MSRLDCSFSNKKLTAAADLNMQRGRRLKGMDEYTTIQELKLLVRKFSDERDWDQYHNPKDLAIGIATEAGELLQLFRFKSVDDIEKMISSPELLEKVREEVADVLIFLLRFCDKNAIDVTSALKEKLVKNAQKYPVEKFKGSNKKYNGP